MLLMSVTLDVSKLSAWLNADAPCAESKGGHAMREEVYGPGGMRALWVWQRRKRHARGRGPTQGCTVPGLCGAHGEHAGHGRDAGGVEVQRLVERLRVVEHVVHGCDTGGIEAQWLVERPHVEEHAVHFRDAGGVEVQRLVERMGALPRVARRAYAAVGGAGRRAGGRRRASTVHAACMGRLDCRLGAGHGEERTRNM